MHRLPVKPSPWLAPMLQSELRRAECSAGALVGSGAIGAPSTITVRDWAAISGQPVSAVNRRVPMPATTGLSPPGAVAFEEKPTTIAVLVQRTTAARPTGIPARAGIFGESLRSAWRVRELAGRGAAAS